MRRHCIAALLQAGLAAATAGIAANAPTPLAPSDTAVERNAFRIFNAVHSALRQWGSSLHHNGMSLLLVTVPAGQLLYHGAESPDREAGVDGSGVDWLAFEVEHAQNFALSWERRQPRPPPGEGEPPGKDPGEPQRGGPSDQKPLTSDDTHPRRPRRPTEPKRAYLHTYSATRPLRLLYIDGMAAGKGSWGTADTQDLLLLANASSPPVGEPPRRRGDMARGVELCALADAWGGLDGFVRMEAGFEVVYCHFEEGGGLALESIIASSFRNETVGPRVESQVTFEWLRAAAGRFHGLPAGRVEVDWGSMVSVLFYDVNISNPAPDRPELPRLLGLLGAERVDIKARVRKVVAERTGGTTGSVDWQGVVDLVVGRYAERLMVLANATADAAMNVVDVLLDVYIDYADGGSVDSLLDRCTGHYLKPALSLRSSWTPEDESIYKGIETVSREICSTFIRIRTILRERHVDSGMDDSEAGEMTREISANLMDKLEWTTRKECGRCPSPDQTCLIPMFPWGGVDDYYRPRCRDVDSLLEEGGPGSYWMGHARWGFETGTPPPPGQFGDHHEQPG